MIGSRPSGRSRATSLGRGGGSCRCFCISSDVRRAARVGSRRPRAHRERQAAGEDLEQDHAEGVDVRRRPEPPALALLGRHGAQRAALFLEGDPGRRGEAQVNQLRPAVLGEEDVVRADVAVNQPVLVNDRQRGGGGLEDLQPVRAQPRVGAGEHVLEVRAVHELLDEVLAARRDHRTPIRRRRSARWGNSGRRPSSAESARPRPRPRRAARSVSACDATSGRIRACRA